MHTVGVTFESKWEIKWFKIKHIYQFLKLLIMNMQLQFLKLKASGNIRYVSYNEIIYLKADGNYTCFMLKDHSKFTMCQ